MEDEAQRCIREARARALARAGISDPCARSPPSPRTPSPTQQSQHGGVVRRPCLPSPVQEPPIEQLISISPTRPPDPQNLQYLSRVSQLSQRPVPQPCPPEPTPQVQEWDYGNLRGPGYEDPAMWEQVQRFDPCMPGGAEGPAPAGSASNYQLLSEICEPEVDVSGTVEDVLGRAHHRARLGAGHRRDVPLFPSPYKPGTATRGPCSPEASQLPPPTRGGCPQFDEPTVNEDYDDLQLLPASALDVGDDFGIECAQRITTDAFGLPFRHYPHAEKARQERLERQRAEALRRQQEARMQAEAQQREQLAAQQAACRVASVAPPPPPTRAGRAGVCPTSARTSSTSRPGTRTASATPRAGPSGTQPSTSRGAGGVCPPPRRKTPAQAAADEKAAKIAAAAAATKARTKYQPPKLKSRPPTKPPTRAKAPRGLDKKPDRGAPDPTRSGMDYDYDFDIQPEQMELSCPESRPIDVDEPVEMEFGPCLGAEMGEANSESDLETCSVVTIPETDSCEGETEAECPEIPVVGPPPPPENEGNWYTCQYSYYDNYGWIKDFCWDNNLN